MKTPLVLFFAVNLCLFGCTNSEVQTAEELNQFVADPDHHLVKESFSNNYKFIVTYRPTDLLVHQEVGDDVVAEEKTIEDLRKKYSNYHYFVLSVSKDNEEALNPAEGVGQYSELVQVMSFRMNEFVTMTTSAQDTIPVGDFILNRTYGISQSTDILFVFKKEKSKDKEWVQFNLNEFGLGAGNQRFRFKVRDLERVPLLRFNVRKT